MLRLAQIHVADLSDRGFAAARCPLSLNRAKGISPTPFSARKLGVFAGATAFNANIGAWDTARVANVYI